MSISRSTSILAVDFGNIHTRASLIDLVDGVYSLVAQAQERTTAGFPHGDVATGFTRVVTHLSAVAGRRLIAQDGQIITPEQPDRTGVDLFLATASIGRPLRTILIGLTPAMSIASAVRAAAGTYVEIVDTISLADQRPPAEQLNAITLSRPDLIFISGGTEGGAREPVLDLARIVRIAVRLMPKGSKPSVLYAGNSDLIPEMAAYFDKITTFFVADNVRPTQEVELLEPTQHQLAQAYNAFAERRGLGFDRVADMSARGVTPTAQSYQTIVEYLGKTTRGVLAIDIGSAVSTLSASLDGYTTTSIRTDIGLGHSARAALDTAGRDAFRAWLPLHASDNDIDAYAMNKTLRPSTIPDTRRALYFEHALLRAAASAMLHDARPTWTPHTALDDPNAPMPYFERIIGAGAGFTATGQPALAAMLLLDALQPVGVTRLQTDPGALIPALGALAPVIPEAVVQVLDAHGLEDLGTCINLSGMPRRGKTAARVRITIGGDVQETHTIQGGEFWVYKLPIGAKAIVRIQAGRGLHINGKRRLKLEVVGGTAGLIVDARGRPLALETSPRGVASQLPAWYAAATGTPVYEIPSDWLDAPQAETSAAPARKPKRDDKPIHSVTGEAPKSKRRQKPKRRGKAEPEAEPEITSADSTARPPESREELDELRNLFP